MFTYNPETGLFYWNADRWRGQTARNPRGHVFCRAGSVVKGSRCAKGYIRMRVATPGRGPEWFASHRLAVAYVTGVDPGPCEVDHINGNPCDNRFANLRVCEKSQNQANARRRRDSRSGFKGVRREGNKWVARCRHNGTRVYLGLYDTPEEAHAAYTAAALKMHGEFANNGRA